MNTDVLHPFGECYGCDWRRASEVAKLLYPGWKSAIRRWSFRHKIFRTLTEAPKHPEWTHKFVIKTEHYKNGILESASERVIV
jgi:hypothetical protein